MWSLKAKSVLCLTWGVKNNRLISSTTFLCLCFESCWLINFRLHACVAAIFAEFVCSSFSLCSMQIKTGAGKVSDSPLTQCKPLCYFQKFRFIFLAPDMAMSLIKWACVCKECRHRMACLCAFFFAPDDVHCRLCLLSFGIFSKRIVIEEASSVGVSLLLWIFFHWAAPHPNILGFLVSFLQQSKEDVSQWRSNFGKEWRQLQAQVSTEFIWKMPSQLAAASRGKNPRKKTESMELLEHVWACEKRK